MNRFTHSLRGQMIGILLLSLSACGILQGENSREKEVAFDASLKDMGYFASAQYVSEKCPKYKLIMNEEIFTQGLVLKLLEAGFTREEIERRFMTLPEERVAEVILEQKNNLGYAGQSEPEACEIGERMVRLDDPSLRYFRM